MASYDASNADCFVLTFKEGLLSPVAHDLRLRVTRFAVDVDTTAGAVEASFDTGSLLVDSALKDGADNPSALSAADKLKIAQQIREQVLHSARYPQATFRSSSLRARPDGGYDVEGELLLHGVKKTLAAQTHLVDGRQRLELSLHQPDFGIVPYRALFGTLQIRAAVTIRLLV